METTAEKIELTLSSALRAKLESEAAKLNLSLSAYIMYLQERLSPACDSARLDRHVREVFGKHGELMRRLAK
jgi:hypothetical protein